MAIYCIDAGAATTRIALAGEDAPRVRVPSARGDDDGLPQTPTSPSRGLAPDWAAAEEVWLAALAAAAPTVDVEAIVITKPLLAPERTTRRLRKFALRIAPRVWVCEAPTLALLGAGLDTGVAVDVGATAARAVPVVDGRAVPHAARAAARLGGDALDARVGQVLTAKGLQFKTKKAFFAAARKVKELAAAVQSERRPLLAEVTIELDDGQSVTLTSEDRLKIGEQLFDGGGVDAVGLHELVLAAAVAAADGAKRARLLNGIFVCGAGSLVDGLPERLGDELRKLAADPSSVRVQAGPRRADAAVVGAAALVNAPDVEVAWASAAQEHLSPGVAAAAAAATPSRSVVAATPRARAALAQASASRDAAPDLVTSSSRRSFSPPPPPASPNTLDIVRQGVERIAAATVAPRSPSLPPRHTPVVADGSEGAPFDLGVESPQAHDPRLGVESPQATIGVGSLRPLEQAHDPRTPHSREAPSPTPSNPSPDKAPPLPPRAPSVDAAARRPFEQSAAEAADAAVLAGLRREGLLRAEVATLKGRRAPLLLYVVAFVTCWLVYTRDREGSRRAH